MAISKERKSEVLHQYGAWLQHSKALFITEYSGLTMKQIDDLRVKVREAGGEFHVVKNTLGKRAFELAGMSVPEGLLEGSTAVSFAFGDIAAMAKTVTEYARTSEFFKVKGGYLDKNAITPDQVKALADLPPISVVRAQLMGTILAPASQLVRILAEPARQVAAVLKAYADKDTAATAA